jgi:hypothetical protein
MLRSNIPWDVIQELSEEEIHMVLGIAAAFDQKQSEDEQRAMASNR